jgi:hypothetical protein
MEVVATLLVVEIVLGLRHLINLRRGRVSKMAGFCD